MSFNLNLKFALKKLRFYLSINHVHQSEKAALNPHKNLRISRLIQYQDSLSLGHILRIW